MTHPACTSRQCVWNVPSEKIVSKPTKIADRNWKSSKLNKGNLVRYSKQKDIGIAATGEMLKNKSPELLG